MYIILEIQKTDVTATLATTYNDESLAYQAYHTALAAASVSTVKIHTVILLDVYGNVIKSETHTH